MKIKKKTSVVLDLQKLGELRDVWLEWRNTKISDRKNKLRETLLNGFGFDAGDFDDPNQMEASLALSFRASRYMAKIRELGLKEGMTVTIAGLPAKIEKISTRQGTLRLRFADGQVERRVSPEMIKTERIKSMPRD